MATWTRSEYIVCSRGGTVVVKPLGGGLREDVIGNGDFLESIRCVRVVWIFACGYDQYLEERKKENDILWVTRAASREVCAA